MTYSVQGLDDRPTTAALPTKAPPQHNPLHPPPSRIRPSASPAAQPGPARRYAVLTKVASFGTRCTRCSPARYHTCVFCSPSHDNARRFGKSPFLAVSSTAYTSALMEIPEPIMTRPSSTGTRGQRKRPPTLSAHTPPGQNACLPGRCGQAGAELVVSSPCRASSTCLLWGPEAQAWMRDSLARSWRCGGARPLGPRRRRHNALSHARATHHSTCHEFPSKGHPRRWA